MDQEKVWDAVADKWAEYRTRTVGEVEEFLDGKCGSVLDLGCGSGRNLIKSDDLEFYGVDFSQNLLDLAEKEGYVELKKSTTDNIPYSDEMFDHIIFVRVLHCVDTEEKRKKTLEEIYRVLKKGGEAVVSVIGPENPRVKNKGKESFIPWTTEGIKHVRYNYNYDQDELEGQLKDAGFEVVSIESGRNIIAFVKKS